MGTSLSESTAIAPAGQGNGRRNGRNRVKPEHVPVSDEALYSIRPAPENAKLYAPVDLDSPDLRALAASIREHGVREPLVVTSDRYILSGHRRHAAAREAGLTTVPCRVLPMRRADDLDAFVRLLREHNRQRVKGLEEQLREELVSVDAEDAYESLLLSRRWEASKNLNSADLLDVPEARKRNAISAAKFPLLRAVKEVLESRRKFWPVSVRALHYPLLNNPPLIHASKPGSRYRNDLRSYRRLDDLLVRARLTGEIPMGCIDDETRPVTICDMHANAQDFIRCEMDALLCGYWRDLMRSQPNHLEIVVEKNTIANVLGPVALEYCIPMTSGRGFASLPPRYKMAQRFQRSGKDCLLVLVVSDFDPEGETIPTSFAASMRDELGVPTKAIKVALTADQSATLDLPPALEVKKTSPNYRKFAAKYGDRGAHELEAVAPAQLQDILRATIDSVIDRDLFLRECQTEREEAAYLQAVRETVLRNLPDLMREDKE